MTSTRNRLAIGLFAIAAVYVVVTLLGTVVGWAIARADTGPVAVAVPSLLEKHGWWGGALLVYGTVAYLLKRNAAEHWIAQGRALALLTAATSIAGSVISWKFGADSDAIMYAVSGAIPLVMSPKVNASAPALPEGSR
jgi:hypothetical protein